jgi:hypothetical protein
MNGRLVSAMEPYWEPALDNSEFQESNLVRLQLILLYSSKRLWGCTDTTCEIDYKYIAKSQRNPDNKVIFFSSK